MIESIKKSRLDYAQLPSPTRLVIRRIAGFVKPYRLRAAVVLTCMALAAILNLALPWFAKQIVDVAVPQGNLELLWLFCTGMIAGPIAAGLVQVAQKYGAEKIGQDVMYDLRVALYGRLSQMPFAFFARQQPGAAVSHVLNDVEGVGSVVSDTLPDIAQNTIVLVATTLFVLALDWRLGMVALGFLPLFIAPTRRVGEKRKALKRRVQERVTELIGVVSETLSVSGALLIKVFGAESTELKRFSAKADEVRTLALEQSLTGRWFRMLLGLFEAIGPALVFGFGGYLVIRAKMPLGTIVAFVTVLKRLYTPASQLANVHVDLLTSCAYFERIFGVLDSTWAMREERSAIEIGRVRGLIEFRDVSFAYDGAQNALSNLSFTIPAGAMVGIVGASGAGKTTAASLVARLYDPDRGAVLVDGVDVRRIRLASLRAQIGVVTQETFLFHSTVLENLRYGNPAASRAEVEKAARRAHIHGVIAALPDGYDTVVGERGYRFSGGERQRLAIARAILKNPRILILDEATSSLDSTSEQLVQSALVPLFGGRTCLVIAHRLATVRDADLIIVLDNGRVVEVGNHRELVANGSMYARLWFAQARRDVRQRSSAGIAATAEGPVVRMAR